MKRSTDEFRMSGDKIQKEEQKNKVRGRIILRSKRTDLSLESELPKDLL